MVTSFLIVFFGLLLMLLRIAQQEYVMAIGAVWVANALTMAVHALYWKRHGLRGALKIGVVAQFAITVAPLLFGKTGLALVLLMLGAEIHYW
ncbi:hypothetical protein [Pseudomonas sp. NPDC089534]|uniref:hypothetical protein n=1 Tax=Pseudomonas sp. NPDC089534 TaxID=3364468 RepID=UPI0037FCB558